MRAFCFFLPDPLMKFGENYTTGIAPKVVVRLSMVTFRAVHSLLFHCCICSLVKYHTFENLVLHKFVFQVKKSKIEIAFEYHVE